MNRAAEKGMDRSNITYTTEESGLFDNSGNVVPFIQQKYSPIIEVIIQQFKNKKKIKEVKLLDIGIGYGAFLKYCEKKEFEMLYGMDPFPTSIEMAKRHTSANIFNGRIENLPWPFEGKFFDVITCIDVVEHLEKPELFFKNVARYINNTGIIAIRTPNKGIPYIMRKLPHIGMKDENPTHINVQKPRYWKALAQKQGYKIIKDWKGEHLTHIRHLDHLTNFLYYKKIDHRKIPLLNMFEQAYIMIIKLQQ
jgi:2-polyprenyl-3-methyl-5-hydroxy-6-metoxy-1,4-benzoquinol methylase